MSARVIRVDWEAWALRGAREIYGCGAAAFLVRPAANEQGERSRAGGYDPFPERLAPYAPAEVRTLVTPAPSPPAQSVADALGWTTKEPSAQPRLREDVSNFTLAPSPGEPQLPGMAEWLATHRNRSAR